MTETKRVDIPPEAEKRRAVVRIMKITPEERARNLQISQKAQGDRLLNELMWGAGLIIALLLFVAGLGLVVSIVQ